jgi:hypothetical protein
LFLYGDKFIDIHFLYQAVDVIEELDTKQGKIRSLRGFFIYSLEIMNTGQPVEVLTTNLQPFFWRKVETIIRQNKKGALIEFLFGTLESQVLHQDSTKEFQRLENLEESQNLVKEGKLNVLSDAHKAPLNAFSQSVQYHNSS